MTVAEPGSRAEVLKALTVDHRTRDIHGYAKQLLKGLTSTPHAVDCILKAVDAIREHLELDPLPSEPDEPGPLARLARIQEHQAKLVKAHPWLSRHIHGGRLARDGLVGPLVDKTAEQKAIDATNPHAL